MTIELNAGIQTYIPLSVKSLTSPCEVIIKANAKVEHLVLTVQSKAGVKNYDADKEVNITEHCQANGFVLMALKGYKGTQKICEWQVEPLHITVAETSIMPISFTELTNNRLANIENDISSIKTAIQEFYKLYTN